MSIKQVNLRPKYHFMWKIFLIPNSEKINYKIISRFLLSKCKLDVPLLKNTYALTRLIKVYSILASSWWSSGQDLVLSPSGPWFDSGQGSLPSSCAPATYQPPRTDHTTFWGFPDGSNSKESTCNAGDLGSIPGLRSYPGKGNDNPLQQSCLENSMDRGVWWATVHGSAKSWTQLRD